MELVFDTKYESLLRLAYVKMYNTCYTKFFVNIKQLLNDKF